MVALNVCQTILRSQVTVCYDNKPPKYSLAGLASPLALAEKEHQLAKPSAIFGN